ncbi:hypothetical protein [Massilia cavernae]|nr:hypothetical protein [Massilia cavernae]
MGGGLAPYDLTLEAVTARGSRMRVRTAGKAVRARDGQVVKVQGAV